MGAGHLDYPARQLSLGHVDFACKFYPQGSSAIAAANQHGQGATASYVSTGRYRITIQSQVNIREFFINAPGLELQAADGSTHALFVGALDETNGTFDIFHKEAADTAAAEPALTDIAANAEHSIMVTGKIATTAAQGSGQ